MREKASVRSCSTAARILDRAESAWGVVGEQGVGPGEKHGPHHL